MRRERSMEKLDRHRPIQRIYVDSWYAQAIITDSSY